MIDLDVLKKHGVTNERLREFFTATTPHHRSVSNLKKKDPEKLERIERDVQERKRFEEMVQDWMDEHITRSLRNHTIYSAVDIAWDSQPIQKAVLPLIQYAQGRIDTKQAAEALQDLPEGQTYIKKNADGSVSSIDLPRFFEVNINLIRSVITRRTAAQSNKYNNSWPFYKCEPRSSTMVGKLRADLLNQRADIMADQYGHRHSQTQETRDMLKYGHCVSFPRASWEREVQWRKAKRDAAFDSGEFGTEKYVVKEGIAWVNPHPARIFWDNNSPLSSLNTDTGCEYVGFWDVTRWGAIRDNPAFFNQSSVGYANATHSWLSYTPFYTQYFDRVIPPSPANPPDAGAENDRKNNVGLYNGQEENVSAFITHIYVKMIPQKWGIGSYPYPIWIHVQTAGDGGTVVYADIMPSGPAAVYSFNEDDNRMVNLGMAHELMPYQDQLTNLFSQLLETAKADLFAIGILNTDVFPDDEKGREAMQEFANIMSGHNYYARPQIIKASLGKLKELGIDVNSDNVFKMVRSAPNTAITNIFNSIAQLIGMAERMMVMSPQEQGQPAPREISATEVNSIQGSTESMYSFISDAIDEAREAKKRIIYESIVAMGESEIALPVSSRYPRSVIEKAGFTVVEEDGGEGIPANDITVRGSKRSLVHEYIFTSRDGGERSSNSQAAQVLVQLMQAMGSLHPAAQTAILSAMGKTKVFEWVNSVFMMADSGFSPNLEVRPGEGDELLMEDDQQVMNAIQQLAQAVKQNTEDIKRITGPQTPMQ